MNNRVLIIAIVLWAFLSFLLNFLTNLLSDLLFPSFAGKPWLIVIAALVALLISIPVSIYISLRTSASDADRPQITVPVNDGNPPIDAIDKRLAEIDHLPSKGYSELVGREKYVGDILAALRDPSGKLMVSIDGMGGIGKTALAREVADRCKKENLFSTMVWLQAPKETFPLSDGEKGIGALTFEAVLDNIARQLGALDVPKLKLAKKETRIKELLLSQRILVVLDNLETAKEDQDEIARKLQLLLNSSKALLTSRRRFKVELFAIHLDDLKPNDAVHFIRQTAGTRNMSHVENADQEELLQIAQTTGSPLALKLIVGQLNSQPLDTVLDQIREIKPSQRDREEDEYVAFYKFIYADSWRLLSGDGQKLLISMSHFAPNVGGTYQAIKVTSDLTDDVLRQCVQELWRLSFLEKGESPNLKTLRYYLHALTQYFVLSDIVKVL